MWQCAENIQDIFVPFLLLYVLFAYIDILAEKPVFGGLLCYGAPTTAESTLACDWLHLYYSICATCAADTVGLHTHTLSYWCSIYVHNVYACAPVCMC